MRVYMGKPLKYIGIVICLFALALFTARQFLSRLAVNSSTIAGVAARSGGHIIPALTVLDKYNKTQKYPLNIHFFTTQCELDYNVISKSKSVVTHVPLYLPAPMEISSYRLIQYPLFFCYCVGACIKSMAHFLQYRPQKIASTGGYIMLPVGIAAWVLGIPLELYELNVVPGKATRLLSCLASHTYVCFPEAKEYFDARSTKLVEYPVRFSDKDRQLTAVDARQQLGLDLYKKTVLVLGGSQGSQWINAAMQQFAQYLDSSTEIQIIHQVGGGQLDDLQKVYADRNIQSLVFGYRSDIELCYQAADLVISRAGAGSLAEILFFQKKTVIIPLKTFDNQHQVDNAKSIQKSHPMLVKVYDQDCLQEKPALFLQAVLELLYDI